MCTSSCAHNIFTGLIFSDGHVRTARKTIHARPRRFDGVFDAVTITVYYWKKYQAYLVLIGDKVLLSLVSMKSKKLL